MDDSKEFWKKNRKTIIILSAIILVGIFLRTYKFHDWLRFSNDQSRDAEIVSSALENKSHLPMLGPNAGVTKFRLGPAYYYFSYASAKIFGNYPDKMAYPSLFFSILAIPLFFVFLREYFSSKMSLSLTAIMSVSYFMVINSRFSSNPNLIPFFFTLYLYALLKLLNDKEKNKFLWCLLAGIGLGIGVQLHTTLLVVMPVVTLCAFAYLLKIKAKNAWRSIVLILAVSLILNASQVFSEMNSGKHSRFGNAKKFISGLQKSSGNNLASNTFLISACQIQANAHIISSLQKDDSCDVIFHKPNEGLAGNFTYYLIMFLGVVFSFAGYFLLWRYFKKEKEPKKKNFLGLIILVNIISFLVLIPVAPIIFVGYFIFLFMVPFVILGLILEDLVKKCGLPGRNLSILTIAVLILFSLARDSLAANRYAKGLENNSKNSTLSEVESMTNYLLSTSEGYSQKYLYGQIDLAERFYNPIHYFAKKSEINIILLKPGDKIEPGIPLYYIESNDTFQQSSAQTVEGREISYVRSFSNQTILILKN